MDSSKGIRLLDMISAGSEKKDNYVSDNGCRRNGSENVVQRRGNSRPPSSACEEVRHSGTARQNQYQKLREFTDHTTLHGLRYIAIHDAHLVRRLFWLCLTLVGCTLLVFQIIDRVQYFYELPVNVNFKVNYNQSLVFPALTICNQNAFRATNAQRTGLYRLIEHMYHNGTALDDLAWLTDSMATNITMEDLFRAAGHRREDFIIRCQWDGGPCGAENFSTTYTDHGLCYTFNRQTDDNPALNISYSGSDHGLKLTLNVEQYEAMPGPYDATGIKLLASDQSPHPQVGAIGVAIPAGAHAFVGLRVIVINNLERPYGDCGDQTLRSSPVYTAELCQLECRAANLASLCGCRLVHMPDLTGEWQLENARVFPSKPNIGLCDYPRGVPSGMNVCTQIPRLPLLTNHGPISPNFNSYD